MKRRRKIEKRENGNQGQRQGKTERNQEGFRL